MKPADLKALTVAPDASLREAIEAIDRSKRQIALVVDRDGKLVATVTDGDVRRGILRGVDLDGSVAQVMHVSPTTVTEGAPDAETRRLIRDRKLQHVPVLDATGHLVDLATVQDLFGVTPNDTRIVLMAGGLGTRLRPLTETVPKPMLPVGGKPILEQIIGLFADQGFWRISISVNYRADIVRDHFGTGEGLGVEIDYIEEEQRMGTAGALSLLKEKPDAPIIVMNGDVLVALHFPDLIPPTVEQIKYLLGDPHGPVDSWWRSISLTCWPSTATRTRPARWSCANTNNRSPTASSAPRAG